MRQITIGKLLGLQQISSPRGTITALALDHRQNLRRANPPSRLTRVIAFQGGCHELAGQVRYGGAARPGGLCSSGHCAASDSPAVGLVVAVESTGYIGEATARQAQVLPGWSVEKSKRMGARAVKLMVYYLPDASTAGEIESFIWTEHSQRQH